MSGICDVFDLYMLMLGFSVEAIIISFSFALFVSSIRKLIWIVYMMIARRFDELDS